ncbi:MAG: hypothetical protein H6Q38_1900 [Chloroflexi bacterium]|nr:hypothetical protein [Chloroflexota bacterium]
MNNVEDNTASNNRLRFAGRVILKALMLFLLLNFVFAIWYPLPTLAKFSAYNVLFPGRQRLPYGDNPSKAYNLSLYNLDAMFASHELAGRVKPDDEFRVLVIGDSASWGFLLEPDQTLAAYINDSRAMLPDGRRVRAYNLGYPVMSLTKDLLILERAMQYEPDMIVWPLTLESFPYDKQLFPPLLQNNLRAVRELIQTHDLSLDTKDANFEELSWWKRTIVGGRRQLADLLRLQLYGVLWAATGIDQDIPETYTLRQEDLEADRGFHNLQPPHLQASDLALEILSAGVRLAGDTPVLLVNEPMFISQGQNSDIRYNFYYPRWAYDDYRRIMSEESQRKNWQYLDLWNAVPGSEFTNSAVHMTPDGTRLYASQVLRAILDVAKSSPK